MYDGPVMTAPRTAMASAELAPAELASTELLVGLDIGTTMTKAAVVGAER